MMPVCARPTSPSAACSSLRMIFSTSSPTYPASVRVVASTMAKGTSRMRASVCAMRVLPVQVDAFAVIVDGHGQLLLGGLLPDHVLVEMFLDFQGLGELMRTGGGLVG